MKTATPITPASTSAARGIRRRARSGGASSRGSDQPAARARKETTRTAAAAAPKSVSGIGRSALPTMPWAMTSTAGESRNDDGPADQRGRRGRSGGWIRPLERLAGAGGAVRRGGRGGRRRVRVRDVEDLHADRMLADLGAADARDERVVAGLQTERVLDLDQRGVRARGGLLQVLRDVDRQLLAVDLVLDARDLRGQRLLHAGVGALLLEVEREQVLAGHEGGDVELQRRRAGRGRVQQRLGGAETSKRALGAGCLALRVELGDRAGLQALGRELERLGERDLDLGSRGLALAVVVDREVDLLGLR